MALVQIEKNNTLESANKRRILPVKLLKTEFGFVMEIDVGCYCTRVEKVVKHRLLAL